MNDMISLARHRKGTEELFHIPLVIRLRFYSIIPNDELVLKKLQDAKPIMNQFRLPKTQHTRPKFPIVLCHGFSGFDYFDFLPLHGLEFLRKKKVLKPTVKKALIHFDYWHGIKEALSNIGAEVIIARVPPYGSIKERSSILNDFLESQASLLLNNPNNSITGEPSFNLIAHSMGGLDCRYLISKMQHKGFDIKSLTTISTPHRGSECADVIMNWLGKLNLSKSLIPRSIIDLTTSRCEEFNKEVIDSPNVSYFSYGARFHPRWYNIFYLSWNLIYHETLRRNKYNSLNSPTDNDGMVRAYSAVWGKYLGTLEGVDHLDLINWTNRFRMAVDEGLFHTHNNFNPIALYLNIAEMLFEEGF